MKLKAHSDTKVGLTFDGTFEDMLKSTMHVEIVCPNCHKKVTIGFSAKAAVEGMVSLKCPECLCQTGLQVGGIEKGKLGLFDVFKFWFRQFIYWLYKKL